MDNTSPQPIRTWVHAFTAGTQTSAQGVTREFSVKDLKQVAESYDPVIHEAPVRIGHEDTDKSPAFGWVKGFRVDGSRLYADVQFTPEMSDMLRNGNYKKVSISMYSPESHINPTPGKWSARHLAVLGATPPAVKGLETIQFTEECFDFADGVTLEAIYNPELGPTLETENSPIQQLQEVLEEHQKSTKKDDSMTDEKNLEVNSELDEELEVSAEQEDSDFAEKGKKMEKQGEEGMDEDEESEDMGDCSSKKKKGASYKEKVSDDHEEVSEDHAGCDKHKKDYKEDCPDCQHGEGDYERVKKNKDIKDQYYNEDEESEDEIEAAHGEETGKSKDGVAQDRMKKSKSKDVQGEGGVNGPKSKGKSKENVGHGKSAVHSAAKVPTKKHAYPKGVQVDNYEEEFSKDEVVDAIMEHEENISEDHYESPMEMTGDTRMANVVEQVTKESQLDAMMKQIEHLSSQCKLMEEENERLRVAAEKAMKDKRRQELNQFVAALYESGKLTDAVMTQEKLVGFCEGLDDGTLEFSEEGESPSGVLLNLLSNLPSQVEYGEFGADAYEFEEESELSPHELALKISEEEGVSFTEALKKVLY